MFATSTSKAIGRLQSCNVRTSRWQITMHDKGMLRTCKPHSAHDCLLVLIYVGWRLVHSPLSICHLFAPLVPTYHTALLHGLGDHDP